jgi:hypothetical protein
MPPTRPGGKVGRSIETEGKAMNRTTRTTRNTGIYRVMGALLVADVALLVVSGVPALKHAEHGWKAVAGDVAWGGFLALSTVLIALAATALVRGRRARIFTGLVVTGAVAALVAAGSLLASASGTTRMHLVEVEVVQGFADAKPAGLSPGDHHTISSDIYDTKHRLVGRADFDCVVTGVGKRLGGLCETVLRLPKGQISGESAWGREQEAPVAMITGGTGAYRLARGQIVLDAETKAGTPFTVELG